ncbi:hypothetical protein SLA2020_120830 [Shorea laevis]
MSEGAQTSEVRSVKLGGTTKTPKTSNPNSPYYLYPSDDLGKVLVATPLNGENYHTWTKAMQNALYAKNKMGFVNGTLKKPAVNH